MNKKIWIAGMLAATLVTCQVSRQSGSKSDMLRTTDESVSAIPAFTDNPSPAHLTPEQSIKTFKLPKDYHLELVASEPMIHEPVAIAWDGNARM